MTQDRDIQYSKRAIELAALGMGLVSPNPLVGCVVVSADGGVVGEGTYIYDDITHAEVTALATAGDKAGGGTAYVSLEPHSHHGKTPPCTDALIDAGIARVVCPIEDPNPLVSGRGFEALRNAGIEVAIGLLADEASRLNEKFICWHTAQRPFVHLKLAVSLDGRISLAESVSTALSGQRGIERVQALRHEYDAILIGGNTSAIDDPSLTDRSGKRRRNPLLRVLLDNRLRLSVDSKLARTAVEVPTVVFTNSIDRAKIADLTDLGVEVIELQMGGRDLSAVLQELKKRDITSVLVEGGSQIAGAFCDARLVDKFTFLFSPIIVGGRTAPVAVAGSGSLSLDKAMRLTNVAVTTLGDDIELTGYPAA
ncbi:MAG: bifunctional diaminohydroxyphosphoribosylaminopyrimidine deaminase/5-amino-6-(5-phosphoribosylamino)uracil reductase RibD [Pyrinomonadaceae bacterium]